MYYTGYIGLVLVAMGFSMVQAGVIKTDVLSNISMVDGTDVKASNTSQRDMFENPTTLRVALYPYIPDSAGDGYRSLQQFIKWEFEKSYPGFTLQMRIINPNEDFYNLPTLKQWLTTGGTDEYDVVEVDTLILGDLVNAGVIAPVSIASSILADWNPSAISAIQFNNAYYGIPHYQCAIFLFTRSPNAAFARTIDELVTSLGGTPTFVHRLIGNLNGTWELPTLWIDSLRDSFMSVSDIEAKALHDYTKFSFEPIRTLARLCDVIGSSNPCIDGTFRDVDQMTDIFARGQATAMFGYSERLFRILKNGHPADINDVKITPLPLGSNYNLPAFFTDAFVFRRNMPLDVEYAAHIFAQFMASPRMQAFVVGSGDNPSYARIPRYLLPVSKMAYNDPLLISDRFYQQVFRQLENVAYPTTGFLNTVDVLRDAITNYIK